MTDSASVAVPAMAGSGRWRQRLDRATAWAKGAWLPLALVLLVALVLRLPAFDRPTHVGFIYYYIDEPKILANSVDVIRGNALLAHWPYALYYWLVPQIVLLYAAYVPSIFAYTHDIFLISSLRQVIALHNDSFVRLIRLNMLLFSLGLVAMVFAYGRRCAGRWGGFAAASVVALAPVMVNHARWAYYDLPMTFWYWTAVGALAWVWKQRSLRGVYACAVLVAWTVTTKQNGAPIALLWFFTMLVVVARSQGLAWYGAWRSRHFWLSGILAVVVGLACYPTLLDPDSLRRLAFTAGSVYVEGDERLGRRLWLALSSRYWPYQGPAWLLGLLAAGLLPLLAFSRDKVVAAMCVAGGVGYYAIVGYSTQGNDRVMLPLVPALALGLAGWIAAIQCVVTVRWLRAMLATALIAIASAPLAYYALKFNLLLTAADTRIQAREWLMANVHPGAKVVVEAHVARLPNLDASQFGRAYATGEHIPGFDVEQVNSVAVQPMGWYREQGYDAVMRTDAMLALAWRSAAQGQEYFRGDGDRQKMGKGTYFRGLPLATIIETYASQRQDATSVMEFMPSDVPGLDSNIVDSRAQFLYHWNRPLIDLWREHDQIILGPAVSVLLVR